MPSTQRTYKAGKWGGPGDYAFWGTTGGGDWDAKIKDDFDARTLWTQGFEALISFELNAHGLSDVDTMTGLNCTMSYRGGLDGAAWMSFRADLRKASDGALIKSGIELLIDTSMVYVRDFGYTYQGLSLTSVEADDLILTFHVFTNNNNPLEAYAQLDHFGGHNGTFGPTMVYTPVFEDIISISSPITLTPQLASAIADAPLVSSSTSKTVAAGSSTSKTVAINSTTSKTVTVDSKRN